MKKSFRIRFSIFSRNSGNDTDRGPCRKNSDRISFDAIRLCKSSSNWPLEIKLNRSRTPCIVSTILKRIRFKLSFKLTAVN